MSISDEDKSFFNLDTQIPGKYYPPPPMPWFGMDIGESLSTLDQCIQKAPFSQQYNNTFNDFTYNVNTYKT
jgi:hypothetical protein